MNKDIKLLYEYLKKHDSGFADFVEQNADLSTEELADKYGVNELVNQQPFCS